MTVIEPDRKKTRQKRGGPCLLSRHWGLAMSRTRLLTREGERAGTHLGAPLAGSHYLAAPVHAENLVWFCCSTHRTTLRALFWLGNCYWRQPRIAR
jgi:hypothetical protein